MLPHGALPRPGGNRSQAIRASWAALAGLPQLARPRRWSIGIGIRLGLGGGRMLSGRWVAYLT